MVIDQLFHRWKNGLCSLKQAALLKRFGTATPKSMTEIRAGELLWRLKPTGGGSHNGATRRAPVGRGYPRHRARHQTIARRGSEAVASDIRIGRIVRALKEIKSNGTRRIARQFLNGR